MNHKLTRTGGQALLIVVFSTALALAVNTFRSRGLSLSRNYFENSNPVVYEPTAKPATVSQTPVGRASTTSQEILPDAKAPVTREATTTGEPEQPIQTDPYPVGETGFCEIQTKQVHDLLQDPRAEAMAILFVDARNDEYYQMGRIPGAVQLDHYYADQYLPSVLPLAEAAEWVVVYCGGGDCEDSIMVCNDLMMEGVPQERLLLYKGGWKEWTAAGYPQETSSDE